MIYNLLIRRKHLLYNVFLLFKKVINYYVNQNGCVYMCMLDASKAFDRVNLLVVFKGLYANGPCPSYLRF